MFNWSISNTSHLVLCQYPYIVCSTSFARCRASRSVTQFSLNKNHQMWSLHKEWFTVNSSPNKSFNSLWHSDAIWWHRTVSTLVHVMACCLFGNTVKPHFWNGLVMSLDDWDHCMHDLMNKSCDTGVIILRPRQTGRHFPDDIFKCIFLNENIWSSITISLIFVPKGPINHVPALVQIMALHLPGDKPLSEPIMVSILTHICVSRPQWVKLIQHDWQSKIFVSRTFCAAEVFSYILRNVNRFCLVVRKNCLVW